jgi:hypothetical protein
MMGESLTRWTIRLCLVLALLALWAACKRSARPNEFRVARGLWSAAWLLMILHVACAFEFYHDWSHAAAWKATARDTAALFNINWGGGLLVNYALIACWTIDIAQLWWAPQRARNRASWLLIAWYGSFIAISFFATVVFESGPTRWLGLAATCCALMLANKVVR